MCGSSSVIGLGNLSLFGQLLKTCGYHSKPKLSKCLATFSAIFEKGQTLAHFLVTFYRNWATVNSDLLVILGHKGVNIFVNAMAVYVPVDGHLCKCVGN